MGSAEQKTGGAIDGSVGALNPPLQPERPVVIRAWPSSWSANKWIVEVFAETYRPVELAVLPISSPCGSKEADKLTEQMLTMRGAKIFSDGRRVFNGTLVAQTLRDRLRHESFLLALAQMTNTFNGLKETQNKEETAARIAEWKKRIEALGHE